MNAVINKEKKENKSETVRRTKEMTQKFVRYKEGANLYSMGHCKFEQLAKEAKATYKIDGIVLVNTMIFEDYLETFREV